MFGDFNIVQGLDDIDLYKLTMLQLAWKKFRKVRVRFEFKNRTEIPLATHIGGNTLFNEFEKIRCMRFTPEMVDYLRALDLFEEGFLQWLLRLRLTSPRAVSNPETGEFRIWIEGKWPEVALWETMIMNVVNRLYFRSVMASHGLSEEQMWAQGVLHLLPKIDVLRQSGMKFVDFGTRRRWSYQWQKWVLSFLKDRVPDQLLGTSNIRLARELGLKPIGTFAHELDMVYQGIYKEDDDVASTLVSHEVMLNDWYELYGDKLSIALSDTYGTEYFLRTFGPQRARAWRGLRQDSGDVFEWGEKVIAWYRSMGIDPREKTLVFSDGLDVEKMASIQEAFGTRAGVVFGWGTNLMNDMGPKALSIVVKAVLVKMPRKRKGVTLVKLSDNAAKVTGSPEAVARIKALSDYHGTFREACTY